MQNKIKLNKQANYKAAKVKIKGPLSVTWSFPHHKYHFSQRQLFEFVDLEDCPQRLNNTQPFPEFFPFGLHIPEQYTSWSPQGLRAQIYTAFYFRKWASQDLPSAFCSSLGMSTQIEEKLKPFTYDYGVLICLIK